MTNEQPFITGTGARPAATKEAPLPSVHPLSNDPILQELASLESSLPEVLTRHDSAAKALAVLVERYPAIEIHQNGCPREWELVGLYFLNRGRWHEALGVFQGLYYQMLRAQEEDQKWIHKGLPLCWICDCYQAMGYAVHAKRYLMLTLCEDALRSKGDISPEEGGIYFRAVWRHGISDQEFKRSANEFYQLSREPGCSVLFPEAILQELSPDWQSEIPSSLESGNYVVNTLYVSNLLKGLGDGTGSALERIAQYLMDCIPHSAHL